MGNTTQTHQNYDVVSRVNHWVIAFAMIGMLIFGLYIENALAPGPGRGQVMGLHKALGVLVLFFGLWRVAWRLGQGFKAGAAPMPKWQGFVAKLVHWILLAGVIIMPLSGLVGSYYSGRAVEVFGIFTVPAGPETEALAEAAYGVHGVFANLMILALVLHVAGALKHHFVDRDATMRRMVGRA